LRHFFDHISRYDGSVTPLFLLPVVAVVSAHQTPVWLWFL
jgi:hypothetical protein